AFSHGVLSSEKYASISHRAEELAALEQKFNAQRITPSQLKELFPEFAEPAPVSSVSPAQLLKRPDAGLHDFVRLYPEIGDLDRIAVLEIEARIKYAGYIDQQHKEFALRESLQAEPLDADFFANIPVAVSKEARMKILAVKPSTVGLLARIPGVRASDLAVILMTIKKRQHLNGNAK
ncbi:MAG: hypothetical protein PHD82_03415, partial [Candidatus Riflebacteria bacterium]|nr:hypothetical protein [Candidatus Riflebacteria bacterium]